MRYPLKGRLAFASVVQEMACIQNALVEWQLLNLAGRSPRLQGEAVAIATSIFDSFIAETGHKNCVLPEDEDPDRLRALLGAFAAVAAAAARSGLAQAWVHAGLAHGDSVNIVWQPERFRRLCRFARAVIRSLDERLIAIDRTGARTTLH